MINGHPPEIIHRGGRIVVACGRCCRIDVISQAIPGVEQVVSADVEIQLPFGGECFPVAGPGAQQIIRSGIGRIAVIEGDAFRIGEGDVGIKSRLQQDVLYLLLQQTLQSRLHRLRQLVTPVHRSVQQPEPNQ